MCTVQKFISISVLSLFGILCVQNDAFAATINANTTTNSESSSSIVEPALMIVSYDAFRPEYFQRNVTPFMNGLAAKATRAEYMRNVFPTKTFVNHFTIATVSSSV